MPYRRVKNPTEVVVFFKIDRRPEAGTPEYEALDRRMYEIVSDIPGFISIKSYASEDGDHLSIVRFRSEGALEAWRTQPEHREAQRRGREEFYSHYWIQICKVVREYEWWRDTVPKEGRAAQGREA